MKSMRLVLVGGFLGAGKTTLLAQATERLTAEGLRVGLVTNDQVAGLVDTANLSARGFTVKEVAGGCFCCRYASLVEAVNAFATESGPEIVIAEPVGSCTDLVATVIQPLRQQYAKRLRIAPLSVVTDALRLRALLDGSAGDRLPDEVLYIYRKQLEEADIIVLNKLDLLEGAEVVRLGAEVDRAFPHAEIRCLSARTGWGVDAWLRDVQRDRPSGQRIPPVDYEVYAAGEAALGWLNATVDLDSQGEGEWGGSATTLLEALRAECADASAEIAHVKAVLALPAGAIVASLTTTRGSVVTSILGQPDLGARSARLIVNARAHMAPEALDAAFGRALNTVNKSGGALTVRERLAIRPGRPVPLHRYPEPTPWPPPEGRAA
jgi:Ni2+-binding GTPase involved in maturation of urease and hydrogenase